MSFYDTELIALLSLKDRSAVARRDWRFKSWDISIRNHTTPWIEHKCTWCCAPVTSSSSTKDSKATHLSTR